MTDSLEYFILEFYLRQHSLMPAHHLVPTLYFGDGLILGKQCMVEWKLTKFLVNNMFNTDNKDNKWKWHRKLHKHENYLFNKSYWQEQQTVIIRDIRYVTYPVLDYMCVTKRFLFLASDSLVGRKNILIRAEGKLWVFLMIVMRMNAVLDWIKHVCFQPALWLTVSAALFFVAVWVFTAWVFATWNSSIT